MCGKIFPENYLRENIPGLIGKIFGDILFNKIIPGKVCGGIYFDKKLSGDVSARKHFCVEHS